MFDTIIMNGTVVLEKTNLSCAIVIDNGRIVSLVENSLVPSAEKVIDAEGKYILPGIIDSHVHLGMIEKFPRDCLTESRAAAAGGITTMITHLIGGDSYLPRIENAASIIETNSIVDVALHVGIMNDLHLTEISSYAENGVRSFKLYMAYKGKDGLRLNITSADDRLIFRTMEAVRNIGGVVLVHAENSDIYYELYNRLKNEDGLKAWDLARPVGNEAESASKACFLAELTGATVGVVHVSSPETLSQVIRYRLKGAAVVAETCPQYLCLNHNDKRIRNPYSAKITPPIRGAESSEGLWNALARGDFNFFGTDHCSNYLNRKVGVDIWQTRAGFPGLETYLPLLLSEGVNKGRISLNQIVLLCCYRNAKFFGLYPRKGNLYPGADADLTIIDLDLEKTVGESGYQGFSDFSPFENWSLKGWPVLTMVRGKIVMQDGFVKGEHGWGCFLQMGNIESIHAH